MPLASSLFDTQRFRAVERETGYKTVVRSIDWASECRADGSFRIMAVSFNADREMVSHKVWTVEKVGDAFTKVAEWVKEIQLTQSIHSITIKRVII